MEKERVKLAGKEVKLLKFYSQLLWAVADELQINKQTQTKKK